MKTSFKKIFIYEQSLHGLRMQKFRLPFCVFPNKAIVCWAGSLGLYLYKTEKSK